MASLTAIAAVCCDSDKDKDNGPEKITLSADRSSIAADGTQEAIFTVKGANGKEVTGESVIRNLTAATDLEGNRFSSTEPGVYKFQATYQGIVSNEVQITAAEPEPVQKVELTADKTKLTADGKDQITFTVTADGVDVTATGASVCYEFGEAGMCIPVRDGKITFFTDTPGDYLFTATYRDVDSDPMTVTAIGG